MFREPCSENWYVDQRRTGWDAMFTFSGKERDQETGYGYFGARYYDSDLSIWLSVDPMASKYPSLSPYVYCANNPLEYVDPDGEGPIGALVGAAVGAITDMVSQTISSRFDNLNSGKKFFSNWSKNIDWADVGISAAVGALDGLAPGAGQLAGSLIGDVAKAAIDVEGGGLKLVGKDKEWKDFGLDLAGNLLNTGMRFGVG